DAVAAIVAGLGTAPVAVARVHAAVGRGASAGVVSWDREVVARVVPGFGRELAGHEGGRSRLTAEEPEHCQRSDEACLMRRHGCMTSAPLTSRGHAETNALNLPAFFWAPRGLAGVHRPQLERPRF